MNASLRQTIAKEIWEASKHAFSLVEIMLRVDEWESLRMYYGLHNWRQVIYKYDGGKTNAEYYFGGEMSMDEYFSLIAVRKRINSGKTIRANWSQVFLEMGSHSLGDIRKAGQTPYEFYVQACEYKPSHQGRAIKI